MDDAIFDILAVVLLLAGLGTKLYRELKGKEVGGIIPTSEPYKPLLGHFEGQILGSRWSGYRYTGQYREFKFTVFIGRDPKRDNELFMIKYNPISIRITLDLPRQSKNRLWVYGKSPGAVFFMKKVRASIPGFDARCHVYSDDLSQSKTFLSDSTRVGAIKELIDKGWADTRLTKIALGKKDIQIVRFYDPSYTQPGFISDTLDRLIILANGM